MNENRCHEARSSSLAALPWRCCSPAARRPAPANDDGRMPVSAAFYPLQFVAERVGGDHVRVTGLTKPGRRAARPRADAAGGRGRSPGRGRSSTSRASSPRSTRPCRPRPRMRGLDVAPAAHLTLTSGDARARPRRGARRRARRATPTRTSGSTPPGSPTSPRAVGEDFARRDPANAADYRANAAALTADLAALDAEFRTGLAQCRTRDLVTGHAAFGYLADALRPAPGGGRGISPDVEPDAATLRDLSARRPRGGGHAPSTPRPWSPPRSPRPSPARPARGWRCSTRSRASPTPRAAATTSR